MTAIWAGVRDRVLALRTAPKANKVFGAALNGHLGGQWGHGFELLPPLTEIELSEIERSLGVRLPAEYRDFLLQVASGGAGPDYGLFPLRPRTEGGDSAGSEHLRRPFLPGPAQEMIDAYEKREPVREACPDEEEYRRAWSAWNDEYDELDAALMAGTLCVSHQGCGYYTLLAVTGPERGTMWNDVRAVGEGVDPVRFLRPEKQRVTFAEWYSDWLLRSERQAGGENGNAPAR
ncbi:SMI1/KNR4 family protein [Streptosporangium lutulentum]|uniref:Knr4/Smi1-like domain-containing protein n=1 Tax=Streptosporangium lutulentum TaxID=1461250 RepID=A0ABT9QNN9_9ACTN|nr:SMI1/KNR4 family protein [Streptosporangium lutulentum]MDP9847986.1 hypothetical protein [Streptosporangium lutulentum]